MCDCTKCYLRAFENPFELNIKRDLDVLKEKVEEHFKIMCIKLREPKRKAAQYYCNELSNHLRELQARQSQGDYQSQLYQRQLSGRQQGAGVGYQQSLLGGVFGGCF